MKTFKIVPRLFAVFGFSMMLALSGGAVDTLPKTDAFTSGVDGWTNGTNVSGALQIARDVTAAKTYDFGVANAGKAVDIVFGYNLPGGWESATGTTQDTLNVLANGDNSVFRFGDGSSTPSGTVSPIVAVLDGSGQLLLQINPDTTADSEIANIDNITITLHAVTSINGYSNFTLRKQMYAKGNMKTIGNTVLVLPTDGNGCNTYTNGTYNTNSASANGDVDLCMYSVDGTQTSATTAELLMPTGSKVLWAGLYWQGVRAGALDADMSVKIRQNSGLYANVSPSKINYRDEGYDYDAGNGISYSAFADVAHLFGDGKWNEGNYTVSGVKTLENGEENGLGTYGAWSLVVIYENSTDEFRSFSVFDGWQKITSSTDALIPISGFYTPNRTLLTNEARVSVFVAEGDKPYTGDQLQTKNYNTGSTVNLETITNNTFNSSVTGGGARTPNATNNFGIDIQSFDIGNLLTPKQTDMNFTFTSSQDVYWPSMIAVSTVLVAPKLCYDYSYKQDGTYLKADNNGFQLPVIIGTISDTPIEASIYLRNNEADIKAEGLSFYTRDTNTSMFTYVDNTVATSNANGSILIPRTDTTGGCSYTDTATTPIGCDFGGKIRIGLGNNATGYSENGAGNLGGKEFVYAKFALDPIGFTGVKTDTNETLGLRLQYYIVPRTGATRIPYDYEFGTDIGLCPPASGYDPVWGTMNVVDRAAATYSINGATLPVNNLRTQISRKPFEIDVAMYGKHTDGTYTIRPTADVNTTVLVEMIDNDAFHDANASCANPDSNISQAIVVPLTIKSGNTGDHTDPVMDQDALFHNFAVKNGSFRIWSFSDSNNTLIQNWSATGLSNANKSFTGITGLYKSGTHTVCATACSTATSKGCYDCIKANYAKPLCSRDNFSVRPESYDVRIFDVNASLLRLDTAKDATKRDLSVITRHSPTFGAGTSPARMNLSAGYDYRFDINATGNDQNLTKVPGYTRFFNGANDDYNATMVWDPRSGQVTTGCNDTDSRSVQFYVANGQMLNEENNQTQVGDYTLNVIDKTWTARDWKEDYIGHHTTAKGFEVIKEDCVVTTDSTVKSNNKFGCITTTTNHTNGTYLYKDHSLAFLPYKFDVNLSHGFGKNNAAIVSGGSGFVYTSDIGVNADMNMSVRSSGPVQAKGFNDGGLSNFVKECYSKDLNISVGHNANTALQFRSRIIDQNSSGVTMGDTGKLSIYDTVLEDDYFSKSDAGVTFPTTRLNFDRNSTDELNIQVVHYSDINVSCATLGDCNISANLDAHYPTGTNPMNFDVTHGYGRYIPTNVKAYGDKAFTQLGYMEVWSSTAPLVINGVTQLPSRLTPNWFVNSFHDNTNLGEASVGLLEGSLSPAMSTTPLYADGNVTFSIPGQTSIPARARVHVNTEGWLWHDSVGTGAYVDPFTGNTVVQCANHPCFSIDVRPVMGRAGSAESGVDKNAKSTTTDTSGWHSTSDYAPAIR